MTIENEQVLKRVADQMGLSVNELLGEFGEGRSKLMKESADSLEFRMRIYFGVDAVMMSRPLWGSSPEEALNSRY